MANPENATWEVQWGQPNCLCLAPLSFDKAMGFLLFQQGVLSKQTSARSSSCSGGIIQFSADEFLLFSSSFFPRFKNWSSSKFEAGKTSCKRFKKVSQIECSHVLASRAINRNLSLRLWKSRVGRARQLLHNLSKLTRVTRHFSLSNLWQFNVQFSAVSSWVKVFLLLYSNCKT